MDGVLDMNWIGGGGYGWIWWIWMGVIWHIFFKWGDRCKYRVGLDMEGTVLFTNYGLASIEANFLFKLEIQISDWKKMARIVPMRILLRK